MSAYTIPYLWAFNPHGDDGAAVFDQEIPLTVRYHVQPDEPNVNVKFSVEIEEITDANGGHYSTDAAFECGWYEGDQERLLEWLLDGNYEDGKPVRARVQA